MRIIGLVIFLALLSTSVLSQNKRLAVIGSSTAKGYGLTNPETESWVNKIRDYYLGKGIIASKADVVNLAQSSTNCVTGMPDGYVSSYAASGFQYPDNARNITAAINLVPKPDVIIVSYPTNGYDWMKFDSIINNLTVIKNTAEAAGIRCYITSTQPRNTFGPGERKILRNLRDTIMKKFGEFAIDFYTVLAEPVSDTILSQYNLDGVHPNVAGHDELFKQVLAKNIFPPLPPPPPPPPPANLPPVANAGDNITITLPLNNVSLNGTGTDSDGSITSFKWNKITGPSQFVITDSTAASTTVTNLTEGQYSFELIVTDNGNLTGKDTVMVDVNAATPPPPPPPPPPPASIPTPEFSDIKAIRVNKKNLLNWTVKYQPQDASYIIQRSRNGSLYETIATVAGSSDTASTVVYSFTDNEPYSTSNFYKVLLTKQSAASIPSKVVALHSFKKTFTVLGMRLIQFRDKVQVEINSEIASRIDVSIVDINGSARKLSPVQLHKGSNVISISLDNISGSIYFLRFSNGIESETVRAVRN